MRIVVFKGWVGAWCQTCYRIICICDMVYEYCDYIWVWEGEIPSGHDMLRGNATEILSEISVIRD